MCNIISFNAINNLGASSSNPEENLIPSLPTELAYVSRCVAFFSPFLFAVVVLLFLSSSFRMTFSRLLWATLQSGSAPSAASNRWAHCIALCLHVLVLQCSCLFVRWFVSFDICLFTITSIKTENSLICGFSNYHNVCLYSCHCL